MIIILWDFFFFLHAVLLSSFLIRKALSKNASTDLSEKLAKKTGTQASLFTETE